MAYASIISCPLPKLFPSHCALIDSSELLQLGSLATPTLRSISVFFQWPCSWFYQNSYYRGLCSHNLYCWVLWIPTNPNKSTGSSCPVACCFCCSVWHMHGNVALLATIWCPGPLWIWLLFGILYANVVHTDHDSDLFLLLCLLAVQATVQLWMFLKILNLWNWKTFKWIVSSDLLIHRFWCTLGPGLSQHFRDIWRAFRKPPRGLDTAITWDL